MEITFTRTEGPGYSIVALRDDGVLLYVPSFDRTFAFPHDLGHYVVERELGLQRGFWGAIAAGALFPGIKVLSGRQSPHAATRSQTILREMGQQGTEAEVYLDVMLAIMNQHAETDPARVQRALREMWRPGKPSRDLPGCAEIQRVCNALREAKQQWHALDAGQSLTVSWPMEARHRRKR